MFHASIFSGDIKKLIHKIQQLVGVTQVDFQALYVQMIERLHEQRTELQLDDTVVTRLLQNTIVALKKRQGYLLPLGSESETSFREREEWTYAVFIAALCQAITPAIRIEKVKVLMPEIGFNWLSRNTRLFASWCEYLQGCAGKNIFTLLIESSVTNHNSVITENETLQKNALATEVEETVIQSMRPSSKILQLTASQFWQWLKEAIAQHTISINEADSVLHRVDLGVLICMPQALDQFFIAKVSELTNHEAITLTHRITLTKAIKKHPELMRNAKSSRIHQYYFNKCEARQILSGIVIRPEILLGINNNYPINSSLTSEL